MLECVVEIRNRYIKLVDVEKQVTNITIKDVPCAFSNNIICGFMQKFGGNLVPSTSCKNEVFISSIDGFTGSAVFLTNFI
jgi:hypothetical protein